MHLPQLPTPSCRTNLAIKHLVYYWTHYCTDPNETKYLQANTWITSKLHPAELPSLNCPHIFIQRPLHICSGFGSKKKQKDKTKQNAPMNNEGRVGNQITHGKRTLELINYDWQKGHNHWCKRKSFASLILKTISWACHTITEKTQFEDIHTHPNLRQTSWYIIAREDRSMANRGEKPSSLRKHSRFSFTMPQQVAK